MMTQTFDHLLLLGRPAAGKSEFIDFMKQTPDAERAASFGIGRFEELDDFVWLWEKFEEDDLWEESGYERVYSLKYGTNYGMKPKMGKLFDLMFSKFNHEAATRYLAHPEFYEQGTVIFEFARGGEHGYRRAIPRLSDEILSRAAILYVKVSFEESCRRNDARYEEKLRHSILAHKVPQETLDHFYRLDDWEEMTERRAEGYLEIRGMKVPYVTMPNEPELTERGPLAERYGPALTRLMSSYAKRGA